MDKYYINIQYKSNTKVISSDENEIKTLADLLNQCI